GWGPPSYERRRPSNEEKESPMLNRRNTNRVSGCLTTTLLAACGGLLACSEPAETDRADDPSGVRLENLDDYLNYAHPITNLSPLPAGCGATLGGTNYRNAEVMPRITQDPNNPAHLIAVYQEDRWSGWGSKALLTQYSYDVGITWTPATTPP